MIPPRMDGGGPSLYAVGRALMVHVLVAAAAAVARAVARLGKPTAFPTAGALDREIAVLSRRSKRGCEQGAAVGRVSLAGGGAKRVSEPPVHGR